MDSEVSYDQRMHLFLVWRAMEDRISSFGHQIESFLYGDGRARHTYLLASTDEHPLVMIEIDMGDAKKLIHKSMILRIAELDTVPSNICQIQCIGYTSSPTALEDLKKAAEKYVQENPHYNVYSNNCRTFVEYLIDQIPEFRQTVPRKNGSILEYYHSRAVEEHPGALIKGKACLKEIHEYHRQNRDYKYAGRLVLNVHEIPKLNVNAEPDIINTYL